MNNENNSENKDLPNNDIENKDALVNKSQENTPPIPSPENQDVTLPTEDAGTEALIQEEVPSPTEAAESVEIPVISDTLPTENLETPSILQDAGTETPVQEKTASLVDTALAESDHPPLEELVETPVLSATLPPEFTSSPEHLQEGAATDTPLKNDKLPLYIIGAVVVFAALLYFVFNGINAAKKNPKKALEEAYFNTKENIENTPQILPELEYSILDPRKSTLEMQMSESPASYLPIPSYLNKTKFLLELKSNLREKEIYTSMAFDSSFYTMKKSEFYLTPDAFQMRIPNLYNDTDFIDINLITFAKDWNASEYGEFNKISVTTSFSRIIDSVLEIIIQGEGKGNPADAMNDLYSASLDSFMDTLEVTYVSSPEDYHHVTGVMTPETFDALMEQLGNDIENNRFYSDQDLTEIIPQDLLDLIDITIEDVIELYGEYLAMQGDAVRGIALEEPLIIHFKIDKNKKLIKEIYIPKLYLNMDRYSDYGETLESSLRFTSDTSKTNQLDDFTLAITPLEDPFISVYEDFYGGSDDTNSDFSGWEDQLDLPEKETPEKEKAVTGEDAFYDEKIESNPEQMVFHRVIMEEEDFKGAIWSVEGHIEEYSGFIPFQATLEYSWNEDEKSKNNFFSRFSMNTESVPRAFSLNLSGLLLSPDKETLTFTNGKMSFNDGLTELMGVKVNFESVPISPQEIAPNIQKTVDFFKIDWEKQILQFTEEILRSADSIA